MDVLKRISLVIFRTISHFANIWPYFPKYEGLSFAMSRENFGFLTETERSLFRYTLEPKIRIDFHFSLWLILYSLWFIND